MRGGDNESAAQPSGQVLPGAGVFGRDAGQPGAVPGAGRAVPVGYAAALAGMRLCAARAGPVRRDARRDAGAAGGGRGGCGNGRHGTLGVCAGEPDEPGLFAVCGGSGLDFGIGPAVCAGGGLGAARVSAAQRPLRRPCRGRAGRGAGAGAEYVGQRGAVRQPERYCLLLPGAGALLFGPAPGAGRRAAGLCDVQAADRVCLFPAFVLPAALAADCGGRGAGAGGVGGRVAGYRHRPR